MLNEFVKRLRSTIQTKRIVLERTLCEQTGIGVQKREELVGRYLQLKEIFVEIDRLYKSGSDELDDDPERDPEEVVGDESEQVGTRRPPSIPPSRRQTTRARPGTWGNE